MAILGACGGDSSDDPSTITLATTLPDGESGDIVVTAQRTGGTRAIAIPFTTRDRTAVEASDYVAASGTLEWSDGDTSDKTIVVTLVDDLVVETAEELVIELGEPPSNVTLDTSSVTAMISDDDGPGDSYALTSAGRLVHFNREEPRLRWSVDLSGFGGEKVLGIDVRPADGLLYALTDAAKLYTVDPMTGSATANATLVADPADTSSPFAGLSGELGIDFDPVTDRLRITSSTGQNLRVDVDSGNVTTDAELNGLSKGYTAIAHHNNVAPACRSSLYAIDAATNRFLTQSTGTDGVVTGVGGLGLDATATGGFDVYTNEEGKSSGLAVLTVDGQTGFFAIDLASGEAIMARASVGPLQAGETLTAIAMPTVPAASAVTQQPGELYGVTATHVISFNRAATAKFCTSAPIQGLAPGETVVGLDIRPSNSVLYILTKTGTAGKLHRLDPISGATSPAINIPIALQGTEFGVDFNPTDTVPLRIISNTGQNVRVTDLVTGAATADSPLNGAGTSAAGAAYTDSLPGAGTSTLYVIDAASDRLRVQTPPNSGTLVDVGPLGIDIADVPGFDVDGRDNNALVVVTVGGSSQLHTIDLSTGALSASLGTIAGPPLVGVARATPQTNVFGVTTENKLVRISLTDPAMVTVISDPELMPPVDTITGLDPGEHLVGIDSRPGNNVIYGIGNLGGVYTLNSATARTNKQGTLAADPIDTSNPFAALAGTAFGVDFNPTALALRVVSDADQNLRIPNVSMPTVFTDTTLSSPGGAVDVSAAAYTNSYIPRDGAPRSTTLYVIDVASGQLMVQAPPNNGTLTAVGPLAASGSFHVPGMPSLTGFDIGGGNNGIALAAIQRPSSGGTLEPFSRLYRVDLATGAATEIGNGIGGAPLRGLAIQIR